MGPALFCSRGAVVASVPGNAPGLFAPVSRSQGGIVVLEAGASLSGQLTEAGRIERPTRLSGSVAVLMQGALRPTNLLTPPPSLVYIHSGSS